MSDQASALKAYIDSIEIEEASIKEHREAIKDILTDAKANGFEPKAIKKIVRDRSRDTSAIEELEEIVDNYKLILKEI